MSKSTGEREDPRGEGDFASDGTLDAGAVAQRAKTGAALVGARSALTQILALGSSIVFARALAPSAMGSVAFGLTLLAAATVLSDGGLGAGMIRRREDPGTADLQTLLGVQLSLTLGLVALIGAVGTQFGTVGALSAVMALALPFTALRAPALIVLERGLNYRTIVTAEFADSVALNAWGVAGVLLGFGTWAIASASVVGEAVGTATMIYLARRGLTSPRLNRQALRRMWGFGARFQAVTIILVVRFQIINFGVAAVGGLATLGVWSLAFRLMRVPFWVLEGLLRVSFPAMARLVRTTVDLESTLSRMASTTAIATGVLLVPLASTSGVLPAAVFGSRWDGVSAVLPFACLGIMISGPLVVAGSGYLYATNDATTPLYATIGNTVLWTSIGIGLLPQLGVAAIGIGWMAGSVAEGAILWWRIPTPSLRRSLAGALFPVVATALGSSAAGYGTIGVLGGGVAAAVCGGMVGTAFFLGACWARRRPDVKAILRAGSAGLGVDRLGSSVSRRASESG